jgi:hypothetical protein
MNDWRIPAFCQAMGINVPIRHGETTEHCEDRAVVTETIAMKNSLGAERNGGCFLCPACPVPPQRKLNAGAQAP